MNEVSKLIDLIQKRAKIVGMLAPSFPVVYKYPQIIARLKRLGFLYVIEVSAGAKKTNDEVLALLQSDPRARFITSPCPSFVNIIKSKYPHLLKYLALKADSPMIATTKIAKEKYPDCQPIFIGPCYAKKIEASNYPDLNLLVLTYKELDEVFRTFGIFENEYETNIFFDIKDHKTRIYPIDGGLTQTSGINKILDEDEIRIVSGWKNCDQALHEFENNPKIKFMDVLFCDGGCVNGPGINSNLTLEERKNKIIEFSRLPY